MGKVILLCVAVLCVAPACGGSSAESGDDAGMRAERVAAAAVAAEHSSITGYEAEDMQVTSAAVFDGECVAVGVTEPAEDVELVVFLRREGSGFKVLDYGTFAMADLEGSSATCRA